MKKVIHIEGMHCQHCAASVTKELEALDGVKDVKVNLSKKQAQVQLDKEVADEAMKEAVKNELENKELYEVELPIELPKSKINLIYIKEQLTQADRKFIKEYLKK